MNQLQTVSEKIYELLPRLKELSFGCTAVCPDGREWIYGGGCFGGTWTSVDGNSFQNMAFDDWIISNPITLEDVLEALYLAGYFIEVDDIKSGEVLPVVVANISNKKVTLLWKLGKPLSEQSPELISILYKLLITE